MKNQGDLKGELKPKIYRMTRQRRVVLEELRKLTTHPNAREIYQLACQRIPNISPGTVYRNLHILKDLGMIRELKYGKAFSRFDGNPENHYHFVCLSCGKIFDLKEPVDFELDKKVAQETGFEVSYHRLEFYGTCRACLPQPGLSR